MTAKPVEDVEAAPGGLLGAVERIGNKVPHPVLMFGYLILLVIVLSWGLSLAGVSVTEFARLSDLSRERIYQIRNGRR